MTLSLQEVIELTQTRTDQLFRFYLEKESTPAEPLQQAMAYAVLNGGKRIRPLLTYATGITLGAAVENLDAPAACLELMHSYSLIHDDLPAMDNAALRRGKLACHKVFGEAMAILAGDALQAFVFQLLALHPSSLNAEQRLKMIAVLSEASGLFGMAAGQALDLTLMDKPMTIEELTHLYSLKTGALLTASIQLGTLAANSDENTVLALKNYGHYLGLAFQIQDDVLDIEGNTTILGKPQGLDAINHKVTYPMLVGIDQSKEKIQELVKLALESIAILGKRGTLLEALAGFLLNRKH